MAHYVILDMLEKLVKLTEACKNVVEESGASIESISTFYLEKLLTSLAVGGEDHGDLVSIIECLYLDVFDDLSSYDNVKSNHETAELVESIGMDFINAMSLAGYGPNDYARMKLYGWSGKFSPIIEVI